jgi:hypothetical protein
VRDQRKNGKVKIRRLKKSKRAQRKKPNGKSRDQDGSFPGGFPDNFPGGMSEVGGDMPGMAGMPGLREFLVIQSSCTSAGSRSDGSLPGCVREPSKYVKTSVTTQRL